MSRAAAAAGFSTSTAKRLEGKNGNEEGVALVNSKREADLSGPKKFEDLSPEAARALEDFGYFQQRYFGRIATPWQIEAANRMIEWLDTPEKEYVVVNCPPGAGKTTLFSHDIPAWATCRNRAVRGLLGSATMTLAKRNLMRLKRSFERVLPEKGDDISVARGLALDAQSTLAYDFGRFKPVDRELWSAEAFVVMQHEEAGQISEKEATWSAYGMDTGFLGSRLDFVIWDDLVDPRKIRTSEQKEALENFWQDVGETRLEPGGLLILQGQRIASDDLYRFSLDMIKPADEEEDDEDAFLEEKISLDSPVAGDRRDKKYHHIIFKAHYEENCDGTEHKKAAKPYPDGCLLDPRRLGWREISTLQANRGERFEVIYQQRDLDPSEVLVPHAWVFGHDEFPGCIDKDRDRLQIPEGINASDCISVASADPSPTMFWAVQWWIYHPPSDQRFLIDLTRKKMDAPDFLDYVAQENRFVGVMEDWQNASETLGFPITTWIVEANAAQRFLLQYDHVKRWQARHGVDIIPHTTHRNKSDKDFGVETIAPHYKFGRIRLPGKGEGKVVSMRLIDEVTRYPHGRTNDCVMAHWFFEWQLPNIYNPAPLGRAAWRPSWVG